MKILHPGDGYMVPLFGQPEPVAQALFSPVMQTTPKSVAACPACSGSHPGPCVGEALTLVDDDLRSIGRLVTVHDGGRTYEGRVQYLHDNGATTIDRNGWRPRPEGAYSRYVKVSPAATIHAMLVRPRPCCLATA